jgi:hypothetical protein
MGSILYKRSIFSRHWYDFESTVWFSCSNVGVSVRSMADIIDGVGDKTWLIYKIDIKELIFFWINIGISISTSGDWWSSVFVVNDCVGSLADWSLAGLAELVVEGDVTINFGGWRLVFTWVFFVLDLIYRKHKQYFEPFYIYSWDLCEKSENMTVVF